MSTDIRGPTVVLLWYCCTRGEVGITEMLTDFRELICAGRIFASERLFKPFTGRKRGHRVAPLVCARRELRVLVDVVAYGGARDKSPR